MDTSCETENNSCSLPEGETRRDFIVLTASAMGALGCACAAVPFISSMNPSSDVLAISSTEVDISNIQPGQILTVMWQGKPVFVRRRTPEEIKAAEDIDIKTLPDPQKDGDRVKKDHREWLVVVGICTHLGCVPIGPKGEFGGWLCPCHGSQYDTSGRVRVGPAPLNLAVPKYEFISETKIRIG